MTPESKDEFYVCSACFEEFPSSFFYKSPSYPKCRNFHCNYCKDCSMKKQKLYKESPALSSIYDINREHSHELLRRIGYDISDLENNPIYDQFLQRHNLTK